MLKPVSGGEKNNNNEGSRVRCWPFFRSMKRKFPLPQTILTCSIDQPRPSSTPASHVHNKLRPARSVDQHKKSVFSNFLSGPRLILYTGTMLRIPSPILFFPYTGDRGQISLSRKEAFADRAFIQEKVLICYQHVLFRWARIRANQKKKFHPESQRRVVDRNGIDAHHEALHGHARRRL